MTTQAVAVPVRKRFTVPEYYQMADAGILHADDRTELIDGEVILMPPIGDAHAWGVTRANDLFSRVFSDVAVVWVQLPIQLDEFSVPQPDIALIRREAQERGTLPRADDVHLVMEIAVTSVSYDRRVKAPLYAQAGLPEYWLRDVNNDTLTIFRDPTPEGYGSEQTLRRGDHIAPLAFPDRTLAVTDLLGDA